VEHEIHTAAAELGQASVSLITTGKRISPYPNEHSRFALYGEVGGMALVYSANFDCRPVPAVSLRAGVAVLPAPWDGHLYVWVMTPVAVTGLLGGPRHFCEVGVGYTPVSVDDEHARFLVPNLGYRYQRPEGGFLFRATVTPMLRANDFGDLLPWAGVSFGRSW
jgi:hypothetical protein